MPTVDMLRPLHPKADEFFIRAAMSDEQKPWFGQTVEGDVPKESVLITDD